jgi:succinyl-diaminopimelate desuccinylase
LKALNEKITKRVKDREKDLFDFCSQLIQAGGENPPGDVSEVANKVEQFLEKEGINHWRYEPEKGHASIISTIGKGKPTLILCGHIDVVPAGDMKNWAFHPYCGEIRDGKILGRGAADMKAGVAAMLMASAILKEFENQLNGTAVFASVSDEETQRAGCGAVGLLQEQRLHGDACLITEPSGYLDIGYQVVAGERGVCWLKIIAEGKPAHGSTPILGENAILRLLDEIPKLKLLERYSVKTPKDALPLVQNGKKILRKVAENRGVSKNELAKSLDHYTVNVGTIFGGTKVNVVPEKCETEVDIRIPAGGNIKGIEEFLRNSLSEHAKFQVVNGIAPSYTSAREKLIEIVQSHGKKAFGYKPPAIYMAATSDAHWFREFLGVPTVAFGPGYGETCHTYNEFVYAEDVSKMAIVYANVIVDYLANG